MEAKDKISSGIQKTFEWYLIKNLKYFSNLKNLKIG